MKQSDKCNEYIERQGWLSSNPFVSVFRLSFVCKCLKLPPNGALKYVRQYLVEKCRYTKGMIDSFDRIYEFAPQNLLAIEGNTGYSYRLEEEV